MEFAYWNAGKLNTKIRGLIRYVVKGCTIFKRNGRFELRPSEAIPRTTHFNSVVTLDLKEFESTNVL